MKRSPPHSTIILLTTLILTLAGTAEASTCPTSNVIQDPAEFQWTSQDGYSSGTLEIDAATLTIGTSTLTTRAYRQAGGSYSIPGPTIRMTPGHTYVLTLKNLLPYAPPSTVENDYKDPNITNIHTHGLHVSPMSPSDDVMRVINGTYCGDYVYQVPSDHMGGTLWYHPHHHGSTYLQVSGGAWGLLLVDDASDGIPAGVAGMTERQLVVGFLDPTVAGTGGGYVDFRDALAHLDRERKGPGESVHAGERMAALASAPRAQRRRAQDRVGGSELRGGPSRP